MVLYNIHELLEKCFADGFTVENISKATDIPVELINRCSSNEFLTQEDTQTLNYLLLFLTLLYGVDTDSDTYLKDMVGSMNNYFGIQLCTVAKYLNLYEHDIKEFLDHPKSFNDSYNISKKLIHLFTTLIRDKRHST